MELQNKVALVTGASRGIGRAIALNLARAGAHVVITARQESLLSEIAHEIESLGQRCFVFAGDIRSEQVVQKIVQEVKQNFQRLDILINNAGVGHFSTIAEMTTGQWDEMFELNIRSVFLLTRECLPYLRAAGESAVVNVASLAGKNTFASGAGYTATKHAVIAFSKCLMLEERAHGVRVLAICPGSVATQFGNKSDGNQRSHITQPEDVAASILHVLQLPQRVMVSELDMRPTNP